MTNCLHCRDASSTGFLASLADPETLIQPRQMTDARPRADWKAIKGMLAAQDGLINRRQVTAAGVTDSDITRLLRRGEWARVHPGVFASHTGPLTPAQRRWAAVLFHEPAALAGVSALAAFGVRGHDDSTRPVVVAVDASRHPDARIGIAVHRIKDYDDVALTNLSPPRVRLECAVLELAGSARTEAAAVAVIADACQTRRTTPQRLAKELTGRPRLRRRRLLGEILNDVASGAYSVLERDYLRRVELPHGLPAAHRQHHVQRGGRVGFRDVEYVEWGVIVELDGRLGHEKAVDRWSDLDRDMAAAVDQRLTVRLGWHQVLEPCRVAGALGRILSARGWAGALIACSADCPTSEAGGNSAPAADSPPLSA